MPITISTTEVLIDAENITFEDLYQEAVTQGLTNIISKLDTHYFIDSSLHLINSATLSGVNITITINGPNCHIEHLSTLSLGAIDANGKTKDGCYFSMPNVTFNYGFGPGGRWSNTSGNLYAYASIIKVPGFWLFSTRENIVKIIDCVITGAGMLSGLDSVFKNNIIEYSDGEFGTLLPSYSQVFDFSHNVVNDTRTTNGKNAAFFYNPDYHRDVTIFYTEFNNYTDLINMEDSRYSTINRYTITLNGCTCKNGYSAIRLDQSTRIKATFKFNPTIVDFNLVPKANLTVTLTDVEGTSYTYTTDANGVLDEWVLFYDDPADAPATYKNPYTINMTDGTNSATYNMTIDRNMENFTMLFLTQFAAPVDYNRIQGMLDNLNVGGGSTDTAFV